MKYLGVIVFIITCGLFAIDCTYVLEWYKRYCVSVFKKYIEPKVQYSALNLESMIHD